ncbi:hypothetical protein [Polaromonas hydrogenivorans]|uniref:Uncharacterized protein n=1 Tax=Polaromonas hydrogenivorans TaxID=335476 RepID=A0AAU7LRQ7_9BURK
MKTDFNRHAQFFAALGIGQFLNAFQNFAQRQDVKNRALSGVVANQSSTAWHRV